jgi:hypothetical protein
MAEIGVSKGTQADGKAVGIRGWLILPLIQLIWTAGTAAYALGTYALLPVLNSADLFDVAAQGANAVRETFGMRFPNPAVETAVASFELVLIFVSWPVVFAALICFLQRKRQTPRLMFVLYGVSAAAALIELVREAYKVSVFWAYIGEPPSLVLPIFRLLLFALPLIWIRYFQVSKRVRATFVR